MYMQSASHVHIIMSSVFGVRIWVRRWISCSSAHGAFNFSPAVFGHLITPTTCKMPPNHIKSRSRTFWRLSTPRPEMAAPRGPECQQRKQHELRCKHCSNSKLKIRTSKQSIHIYSQLSIQESDNGYLFALLMVLHPQMQNLASSLYWHLILLRLQLIAMSRSHRGNKDNTTMRIPSTLHLICNRWAMELQAQIMAWACSNTKHLPRSICKTVLNGYDANEPGEFPLSGPFREGLGKKLQ